MSELERDPLEVARARKAQAFKVFIYCDDPSHPKRVAVTNFIALPDGGWHEEPSSRAATGKIGSGMHLIGDTPGGTGWANDPDVNNADVRSRFEFSCRRCHNPVPVSARAENLFPVLDGLQTNGVSEVPLTLIAASLKWKAGN